MLYKLLRCLINFDIEANSNFAIANVIARQKYKKVESGRFKKMKDPEPGTWNLEPANTSHNGEMEFLQLDRDCTACTLCSISMFIKSVFL